MYLQVGPIWGLNEVVLPRMTLVCSAKPVRRELGRASQCSGGAGFPRQVGLDPRLPPQSSQQRLQSHLRTMCEAPAVQTCAASALPRISLKTPFVCTLGLAICESSYTCICNMGSARQFWCVTPAFGCSKSREQGQEMNGNDL